MSDTRTPRTDSARITERNGCVATFQGREVVPAVKMAELERENARLREAAQAVVDRWETPLWKDAEPTAVVIHRLRDELQ